MNDTLTIILLFLSITATGAAVWFHLLARRGARERDLLLEVGTRISATLERDEVLGLILDGLEEVVGYDAAGIFLVDIETDQVSYHLLRGYDEEAVARVDLKIGKGLVGRAAEIEQPVVVADVREEPGYVDIRPETRSEIVLPLMVHGF